MNKEQNIILKSQGSMVVRSAWQIGQLFLSNKRIFFMQIKKCQFEINLDRIIEISIKKRTWLLGCKVKQLCIEYRGENGCEQVCIALAEPAKWVLTIKKTITLMLLERWDQNGAKPESPNNS
jgi:hypothetical protein